ncbi:unnamed protein product [Prorocentrum cordatum]|uniref:Aspartyl/asparaginy/proline hydroxylase domain-containing protein n=1 Tax=Prorocentrum cordatum TaxID=2364126 RepID=A0ABN9QIF9_9DINO|nr:unnamed protein product [Polarella glacialis]
MDVGKTSVAVWAQATFAHVMLASSFAAQGRVPGVQMNLQSLRLLSFPSFVLLSITAGLSVDEDDEYLSKLRHGVETALRAVPFDREAQGGLGAFNVDWAVAHDGRVSLAAAVRAKPTDVRARAAYGAFLAAFTENDSASAAELTAALAIEPDNYMALLALGLLQGNVHALEEAARLHPEQAEPLLAIGSHAGPGSSGLVSVAEGAAALRRAISVRPRSRLVVGLAGEGLRRLGFEEEAAQAFKLAVERGVWHHPLQRPKHAFWPALPSDVLDPGALLESMCPSCREARSYVEAALRQEALRDEFQIARLTEQLEHSGVGYWIHSCEKNSTCSLEGLGMIDHGSGSWAEYTIWDPARHDPAMCFWDTFPKMCKLVGHLRGSGLPMTRLGVSEVHPPRTYIPRHSSPQQGRFRLQCPLVVPLGSKSRLIFRGHHEIAYGSSRAGDCFWFDESFEHEVDYRGRSARASLLLDVPHPALLAELRRLRDPSEDNGSRLLTLELEAPSSPRYWALLWGPMAALARQLGLHAALPQTQAGAQAIEPRLQG